MPLDHVDDSFECLERSRQCIENPDQRFYEPEMHRHFGAFFRHRGESRRAEASYTRGDRSGACPGGALMGIARRDGFGSALA
jgi:hypothetical protein